MAVEQFRFRSLRIRAYGFRVKVWDSMGSLDPKFALAFFGG